MMDGISAPGVPRLGLKKFEILWVNTGTLCNISCTGCFMESTPSNDSLAYFKLAAFLDLLPAAPEEIGFTGGEPFMNPDLLAMLRAALEAGRRVLVLTNAMRPMLRLAEPLAALIADYPGMVTLRVSLDHYTAETHEAVRGAGSFAPGLAGLTFLSGTQARLAVACRAGGCESQAALRAGFAGLFAAAGIRLDADDPADLVLFPEMNAAKAACTVTAGALAALQMAPMCASSRMVVQRKGEAQVSFVPCTLLPERDLADPLAAVALDHPFCSQFCVYGGASCAG
jgi:hypothetical protein